MPKRREASMSPSAPSKHPAAMQSRPDLQEIPMRSKLLKPSFPVSRSIALVLIVAVVATSGCRWFRKDKDVYAQSPESRPLEVPPDLDMPNTDGAMKMPP